MLKYNITPKHQWLPGPDLAVKTFQILSSLWLPDVIIIIYQICDSYNLSWGIPAKPQWLPDEVEFSLEHLLHLGQHPEGGDRRQPQKTVAELPDVVQWIRPGKIAKQGITLRCVDRVPYFLFLAKIPFFLRLHIWQHFCHRLQ